MTESLRHRDTSLAEWMDDPACDQEKLARTFAHFAKINSLLSGWPTIYRRTLRPALQAGASTILDVGCGGGDVVRQLARLARRDGFAVTFLGIDPDPRAIEFARSQERQIRLSFECADVYNFDVPCDLLISNHVLHHLSDEEFPEFCRASERLSRCGVVHNDLSRSGLALGLYPFVGGWFRGSYILEDGLRSIRRSYTPKELAALASPGWTVDATAPFRLQLLWKP